MVTRLARHIAWAAIAVTLIFWPTLSEAQTGQQRMVSFTVAMAFTNATASVLVSEQTYDVANVNCDYLDPVVVPPKVVNPTKLFFWNPYDPTRRCVIDTTAQVASMPEGIGYRTRVRVNGPLSSADWSPESNSWDRIISLPPPQAQQPDAVP